VSEVCSLPASLKYDSKNAGEFHFVAPSRTLLAVSDDGISVVILSGDELWNFHEIPMSPDEMMRRHHWPPTFGAGLGSASREEAMTLAEISLGTFSVFSGLRLVSYLPQICRVARDANGASAISYSTWLLWTGSNLSTGFYAAINLGDRLLAACSGLYALCCVLVIVMTVIKRRRYSSPAPQLTPSFPIWNAVLRGLPNRRKHLRSGSVRFPSTP
jgi:hypothetical protein